MKLFALLLLLLAGCQQPYVPETRMFPWHKDEDAAKPLKPVDEHDREYMKKYRPYDIGKRIV